MTTTEIVTLIAALTALGSTFLLPLIKNYSGFQTNKLNDVTSWRQYLASELAKRDERIKELDLKVAEAIKETQKWRDLYYEQLTVNNKQASEISILRDDNQSLSERVGQLQDLVSKNATIVQANADNVSSAMDVAKKEIKGI